MGLTAGTKLGPYEIVGPLGAGGMGEVYRAKDTRLGREVALKILPEHLANTTEAKQRFEREARAVSSLSHANICPLFDVGSQDGMEYLVMECLEGESLAQRLARGPLRIEEVQRIGIEIAEALETAHRQGIIHRDLKPGNVMLTKSGSKLMDFGLAKPSMGMTAASDLLTPSGPTMSVAALTAAVSNGSPLTQKGTIVGTFQYIAPEVLQGKEADARSDIFSLGCVLFEMATGKRAFEGKSQLSVFTAILENEPPLVSSVQPASPRALDDVVKNCLVKDPEERYSSAHDVKLQLRSMEPRSGVTAALPKSTPDRKQASLLAAAGVLALVAAGWLGYAVLGKKQAELLLRVQLTPPEKTNFTDTGDFGGAPVLSPQGDKIAFSAEGPNSAKALWVRALDSFAAQRLEGTEGGAHPFWSPDGRYLGFFAKGKLNKVLAAGGPVFTVTDAVNPRGGTWCNGDVMVYAPNFLGGLKKVSANGGAASDLTVMDATIHSTHRWPSCLPDGKHLLYLATNHQGGLSEKNGVYFVGLDGQDTKQIVQSDAGAQYASGYLLFHSQTAVMAQSFDADRGKLNGEAVALLDRVKFDTGVWRALFTVSESGKLAYFPGGPGAAGSELVLYDRSGKVMKTVGEMGSYMTPQFSPDGKRIAFVTGDPVWNVWVLDLERGTRTRITFDPTIKAQPRWSADGKMLAYLVRKGGVPGMIRAKAANGTGGEETLVDEAGNSAEFPQYSPDGNYIVYLRRVNGRGLEIMAKPLAGGVQPVRVVGETGPQAGLMSFRISPNGKWIAYESDESGKFEVYIAPFPKGEGRWQVSSGGGDFPSWRRDGRELFSITPGGDVYATEIIERGGELQVATPKLLFHAENIAAIGSPFDASPDGQTFVVQKAGLESHDALNLVTSWKAELKK
jgi:eukaryotic-like serine/threonine-protein kinase